MSRGRHARSKLRLGWIPVLLTFATVLTLLLAGAAFAGLNTGWYFLKGSRPDDFSETFSVAASAFLSGLSCDFSCAPTVSDKQPIADKIAADINKKRNGFL